MDYDFRITKDIADIIVKICFDTVEFSRLFDEENSQNAKWYFQCNEEIKRGLKWFIGSENYQNMYKNVGAYIKSVETALLVYNNLNLPFKNKNEIIGALSNLRTHLSELQQQIIKNYSK